MFGLTKMGNLLYSCFLYAGMFAGMMVTMTYFKQDGMLYHPAVPDERYRSPDNMPPGYRNPKEQGMNYDNVYITYLFTISRFSTCSASPLKKSAKSIVLTVPTSQYNSISQVDEQY